jgi:predicted Zn-dependent peptidase
LRGRHERSAQTATGTLAGYSGSYYFDDIIEYEDTFNERLEAVSVASIQSVVQKVTSDVWTLGVLGNCTQQEANELRNSILPLFNS